MSGDSTAPAPARPGIPVAGAHQAANLAYALTSTARRFPDATAVIHGDIRWSWRELNDRVSALSNRMNEIGVKAGDCVMLDGPNHPEFIQSMYATWRIGAVLAPVNSRLHDHDIAQIASVCKPVLMIAHASTGTHVAAVESVVGGLQGTLWLDQFGPAAVSSCATTAAVADSRVLVGAAAWYFFTSGTSGSPKAAVLTHDQLGYVTTNHLLDLMPTTRETDRSLVVAPLSHGAGVHLLPQVARGAATVIPSSSSLDPLEVWQLVEREQVSNIFTVPTILNRLVDDPAVDAHDHTSIKYVIYAGAPMAGRDQRKARQALGDVLVQYYGLGEVTGNITVLPPHQHDHPSPDGVQFGTCGYARTGMQISVQDDDGVELPPLRAGEICVAGPGVFPGYLDNPEANEVAFRDGWFRTGDIGMLDDEGYLFITGRRSDMYISGGSNVHPRDIEEKLLEHPAISEAVVLGVPDPTWGESGAAVCVLAAGQSIDVEELRDWLTERMARYKVPRHVVFWDELPRSGYGKVVRRTIRDMLLEAGWDADGPATATAGSGGVR